MFSIMFKLQINYNMSLNWDLTMKNEKEPKFSEPEVTRDYDKYKIPCVMYESRLYVMYNLSANVQVSIFFIWFVTRVEFFRGFKLLEILYIII